MPIIRDIFYGKYNAQFKASGITKELDLYAVEVNEYIAELEKAVGKEHIPTLSKLLHASIKLAKEYEFIGFYNGIKFSYELRSELTNESVVESPQQDGLIPD